MQNDDVSTPWMILNATTVLLMKKKNGLMDLATVLTIQILTDDFTGELLYIECHPFVVQHNKDNKPSSHSEFFTKSHLRHSTRGKFLRLIRKRESKRKKKNQKPVEVADTTTTSKVKFQMVRKKRSC
nr:unnamed protein product [Callosobruchus analis]